MIKNLSNNGITWMLLWCVTFTISMTIAKFANGHIHIIVMLFSRCLFGLLFLMPFLYRQGFQHLKSEKWKLHGLRIGGMCSAMICTYSAYTLLPLALATTLGFTMPMVIALLSIFILKDHITWQQWAAIIIGYIGVWCTIMPDVNGSYYGIIIALLANFFAGFVVIIVKLLTKTEHSLTILTYGNIGTLAIMSILLPWFWLQPSMLGLSLAALLGVSATISQWCYIKAVENGRPALLSSFEYSRLLLALPIGLICFNEEIVSVMLLGSILIISGNSYIGYVYQNKPS